MIGEPINLLITEDGDTLLLEDGDTELACEESGGTLGVAGPWYAPMGLATGSYVRLTGGGAVKITSDA